MKRTIAKVSVCLLACLFVGGLSVSPVLAASEHGGDGKCGEGKCGGEKKEGKKETKDEKKGEGDTHKESGDGKCGQGKCGASK